MTIVESSKPVDNTMPESSWAFDESVTDVFEDMLRRSIPQYDVMRQSVFDIGKYFMDRSVGTVVDLGCSRGDSLRMFVESGEHNDFIGIEISEPMFKVAQESFHGVSNVQILSMDLRDEYPKFNSSLTLSILTLQFTPIEHRQHIIQRVYDSLEPGGAFILVEKILGSSAPMDELMVDTYYGMKSANGYSQEAIDRKRLALEGVLVPVTAKWNEELLTSAGFKQVDFFWRWMNFAGWIAVKGK